MTTLVPILAGIAWDPEIRGILSVLVGVVVLMGSVYLLLATNLANRLGFLLALTAIFGWMTIHGLVWLIYPPGTGPAGRGPAWEVAGDRLRRPVRVDARRGPRRSTRRRCPPSGRDRRARRPKRSRPSARSTPTSSTSGRCWPRPTPPAARRRRRSTRCWPRARSPAWRRPTPGSSPTPSRPAASPSARATAWSTGSPTASATRCASPTRRTTRSCSCSRPPSRRPSPVRSRTSPRPTRTRRPSRSCWCATSASAGCRPTLIFTGSGLMFGLLCVMLHQRDRRVAEHRSAPLPAPTGG